ncbi:hypothetical protein NQ318_007257 [Aromia moschata]|uniref:Uncharacterized protein n=1 Tax=Aromia moschata TaxID=1265417 RepID=A0AAV8XTQ9_9CUCU|nr:hypothetical protein NQ318_007257 [Aromia moschata]
MVLHQEEKKRKQIMEKVAKLEQRLLSLQSAQAMRCHSCRPYVSRMATLETKLTKLIAERRQNLQELAHMKSVNQIPCEFEVIEDCILSKQIKRELFYQA